MELTRHRVPGVDHFEYDGNRRELLRRVLRANDASMWLLSALPARNELPFVGDAVDWAFVTEFATRVSWLTPTTFADEMVRLEYFIGDGPFLAATPNPAGAGREGGEKGAEPPPERRLDTLRARGQGPRRAGHRAGAGAGFDGSPGVVCLVSHVRPLPRAPPPCMGPLVPASRGSEP